MKKSEYEDINKCLCMWFIQNREKSIPLSSVFLKEKALQFYTSLHDCSHIENMEKRYGVRELKICGEKLSAEEKRGELEIFKRHFQRMIERKN